MIEVSADGLLLVVVFSGGFGYWLGYLVGYSCAKQDGEVRK